MINLRAFTRTVGKTKKLSALFISIPLLLAAIFIAFNVVQVSAVGPTSVPLGTAAYFSVLAGSGITNTGPTTITADAGT
jgi:hypothetical protein